MSDNVNIEIFSNSDLPRETEAILVRWSDEIFSPPELQHHWFEGDLEWNEPDWHMLLYLDGEMASSLFIVEQKIMAGEARYDIAGIGGVMTPRKFRGQGLASHLMKRAETFMRKSLKKDFGILFCLNCLLDLYARLGWQRITAPVMFRQGTGIFRWEEEAMYLPLLEDKFAHGAVDLCGPVW